MLSELRINLEFFLTDWLKIDELLQRPRFADHSWESITDLLHAAERIAARVVALAAKSLAPVA